MLLKFSNPIKLSININICLFKILNNYFLKSKTPSDGTLLGRTSGGFCCIFILLCFHFVVDVLYFIFDFHFVVICRVSLFPCCFSTSSLTLPWTITRFLDPFYTFSPAHHRFIHDTINFYHSVIFLPRALRFWVDVFYPRVFFILRSFTDIWQNLLLSRPPSEPAVLPWSSQGFITDLRNTNPAHLFVWNTENPQTSYSERFSFKAYLIIEKLLVVHSVNNKLFMNYVFIYLYLWVTWDVSIRLQIVIIRKDCDDKILWWLKKDCDDRKKLWWKCIMMITVV